MVIGVREIMRVAVAVQYVERGRVSIDGLREIPSEGEGAYSAISVARYHLLLRGKRDG